jgi:Ca-activated chloride channel family protein
MMKFANPYLLNLLWGIIPLVGLMVYGILKRKKILSAFAAVNMWSSIIPGLDHNRRWIKLILITMAFAFAIIALAQPQLGFKWEKTTQKGVDIMIALDCSQSMLAQDIKPNRLERAKREVIDLLRMMKSDRAGLVAFSGRAILQCPLTLDHEAFNIFLKVLEPGFLPVGGTNLDEAVKESFKGFEPDSDTEKAIIIITDGESTTGAVEETAKEMAKQGVKIFCIGVGDLQGAPIPDENGGFKKDASGNIVLAKVDEQGLEKIAAITGGAYVRSVAGDMDLDLIYKDKILGTMERRTLTSGKKKVWENRYQWFLFPCLLLLLIEFLLSSKKRVSPIIFALAFLIHGLVFNTQTIEAKMVSTSVKEGIEAFDEQNYEQAKKHFIDAQLENPENAKLYYNIGAAAYMNKEYEQAMKNFLQATHSDDKSMRHAARYNLSNTHYRLGNMDAAIKGYEDILKDFPEDTQAKENMELAIQKKQEQEKQKSESDKDKKDKNQKDKDQQDKDKKGDQDQDQEKQDQENKDQNNKDQKNKDSEQNKDQPGSKDQDEQPPEPRPESEKDKSQKSQEEKAKPAEDKEGEANKNMESMLNRLEDKPGKAMMPLLQEQYIEKDW